MTPEQLVTLAIPSSISHLLFGALGGLVWCAVMRLHREPVTWTDIALRPFLGAVAAVVLTDLLGLPNHFTSLFAGYFGVDALKGLAIYAKSKAPWLNAQPPAEKK